MALKSFRVTKKEIQTYYQPKVSAYDTMIQSINSPMGYGQMIQYYGDFGSTVYNTSYHVYSNRIGEPIVYDVTNGVEVLSSQAGPSFWSVSSQEGLNFLEGIDSLPNYRKLKYCNDCEDGNGLNKPVIDNFKQRFSQVNEMVTLYNLLEGFLFYDLSLPKYQNVFPAVKVDDGINVDYKFKNVTNGADLTAGEVSTITQKPVVEIELSVDTAPIIKPQEGANTVITSCCDETISYIINGQYDVGSILFTTELTESYCWYVESLTKEIPNVPVSTTFTNGGRSCKQCVYDNGCPTGCEEVWLVYSLDPSDVCNQTSYNSYAVDWTTGVLRIYNNGSGGVLLDCDTLVSAAVGYYSDGKAIWFWDQNTLKEHGPCGGGSNTLIMECCSGKQHVIEGTYPDKSTLYTKDLDPATCFSVLTSTSDSATLFVQMNLYERDCGECIQSYPGGCK